MMRRFRAHAFSPVVQELNLARLDSLATSSPELKDKLSPKVASSTALMHPRAAFMLLTALSTPDLASVPTLAINSGFRSYLDQLKLFRRYLYRTRSYEKTIARVAPPLYSQHHTGFAVDLQDFPFEQSSVLRQYGFYQSMCRVPGIVEEPWHWFFSATALHTVEHLNDYKPDALNRKHFRFCTVLDFVKISRESYLAELEYICSCYGILSGTRFSNTVQFLGEITERSGIVAPDSVDEAIFLSHLLFSLVPGETSMPIKTLQSMLNIIGYRVPETGFFGKVTGEHLRRFCELRDCVYPGYCSPSLFSEIANLAQTPCWFQTLDGLSSCSSNQWTKRSNTSRFLRLKLISEADLIDDQATLYVHKESNNSSKLAEKINSSKWHNDICFVSQSEDLLAQITNPRVNTLYIKSLNNFLCRLALKSRSLLSTTVIAVTGSSGKTTTKDCLAHLLSHFASCHKSPGSANTLRSACYEVINLPLRADYFVCECGLGASGSSLREMSHILRPDIAIVTCVHDAHIEGYKDIDELRQKKLEIASHLNSNAVVIVDGDDPPLRKLALSLIPSERIYFFGFDADNHAQCLQSSDADADGELLIRVFESSYKICSALTGHHWAKMFALNLLVSSLLDIDLQIAINSLEKFELPAGRGNILGRPPRTLVLYDSHYNANPGSMKAELISFLSHSVHADALCTIAIIGNMEELGSTSVASHRSVLSLVNESSFSHVLIVGEKFSAHVDLMSVPFTIFANADQVVSYLSDNLKGNEYVFLKGSHSNNLALVASYLRSFINSQLSVG